MIESVILSVSGVHCGTCAMTVSDLIKSQPGVEKAIVDYGTQKAEVEFDPEKISLEEIIKTVDDAGLKYHLSREER
ncbi:MAG: heavy metal-associated domain-containing protein [bacterium]|nr:heavy metal-associated domain-containing protein [bacterium]